MLAATPPMGWNSWDGYGTTINEDQFKANADWFAKHLKPFGWQYVVIDMEWFVTNPKPEGNSKTSKFSIDGFGRYTPAVEQISIGGEWRGVQAIGGLRPFVGAEVRHPHSSGNSEGGCR